MVSRILTRYAVEPLFLDFQQFSRLVFSLIALKIILFDVVAFSAVIIGMRSVNKGWVS